MSSLLVRLRLFFGSYAPLFLIAAVRFDGRVLRAALLILGGIGVLTTVLLIRTSKRLSANPFAIAQVSDRGPDVAGYVATYLLPFLVVPTPTGRDLVAYVLVLAVVAAVYIQSDMLSINPLLYLFGYRVLRVITGSGQGSHLVTRSRPRPGDSILAVRLAGGVLFETDRRRS